MSPALITSLVAAAAAFLWLRSALPLQNALAFAGLTAAVSTGVRFLEIAVFPPAHASAENLAVEMTARIAGTFAIIVCARGTARLALWRRRHSPNVGLQVIALATGLAVVLPFGGWTAIGRFLFTPLCLILGTPWLIDKRGVDSPPDFRPLWIWLGMGLFALVQSFVYHG